MLLLCVCVYTHADGVIACLGGQVDEVVFICTGEHPGT